MNKGIVYLIQPVEFIGSNTYKIGCSKSPKLNRVKNGYREGSRYICVMECVDPFGIEKQLKLVFNEKFKLAKGKEYFEGNEGDMTKVFTDTVLSNINYNEDPECIACGDTGTSYWAEDIYGTCLLCRCINCKEQNKKCICHECKKCGELICGDEEHTC